MSLSRYLLGIDVGTEGCKAIIFNDRGESLARAYQEYPIIIPRPSWAEQDPRLWWEAVKRVVSDVIKMADVHSEQIVGVGLSGQSPVLVLVDEHGNPLMNAILWMDRRAVKQAETIMKTTGIKEDPSFILAKVLWVKDEHPKVFQRSYKFLQSADFIEYKLTGNFVTDWFNASTCHYDVKENRWPNGVLSQLEIPVEKFPSVFRPGRIVGAVSDEASRGTGLKKDTPVVAGGIDAFLAVIGVNALEKGCACDITGSSTCLMVSSDREVLDPKGRVGSGAFLVVPNLWITSGIMSTTGASLRWFRNNFGYPGESYEDLDVEAEKAPLGSDGLIFLPYMMGERSPIWDPSARGVFVGLSLKHTRKHVIRAILEGCAFGIRHNLEVIEKSGVKVDEIRSCGGAAKSIFFGQIKADVTGKPILLPRETEASVLGAAILGAVGVGIYGNVSEASKNMVQIKRRISPRKVSHEKYGLFFRMYKEAYLELRDYFMRYYSPIA